MQKEIRNHKIIYLILGVILVFALYVRVHGLGTVLGFYFDQGRDALVIWDFIHSHKFFLIGPTTGLPGIFRGPYYYYLIAPFYLLGRGNPVWPANFLALTSVFAIVLIYYLGAKIQDRRTGIIAAIIASFSFYIVMASRWLSNPTPMLLLSMLLVSSMFQITRITREKSQKWWVVIALVSGLSLFNFGSSGEFFYFPALFIFAIWQRRKWPNLRFFLFSIIAFIVTFAPLVLFDLKHEHILLHNFFSTFGTDGGSFKKITSFIFQERNKAYYDIFTNKLFDARGSKEIVVMVLVAIAFLLSLPKLIKNDGVKIILLLLISPIIGLYFYQGNYGVLYDYYMTGYYLIFILLFAIGLGRILKVKIIGVLFVLYFFYLFFTGNIPIVLSRINDRCNTLESICFVNQKQAIDWIYNDAKRSDFNVDVYVPPVIPYAYDYLFKWYGGKVHGKEPNVNRTQILYTLYEADPPHPERLDAWLARQKGIGKVQETMKFGAITVERRIRIEANKK